MTRSNHPTEALGSALTPHHQGMTLPTHDQVMSGLRAELESLMLTVGKPGNSTYMLRAKFLLFKKLACCAFKEDQKPIVLAATQAILLWDHKCPFLVFLEAVLKELTEKYPAP